MPNSHIEFLPPFCPQMEVLELLVDVVCQELSGKLRRNSNLRTCTSRVASKIVFPPAISITRAWLRGHETIMSPARVLRLVHSLDTGAPLHVEHVIYCLKGPHYAPCFLPAGCHRRNAFFFILLQTKLDDVKMPRENFFLPHKHETDHDGANFNRVASEIVFQLVHTDTGARDAGVICCSSGGH